MKYVFGPVPSRRLGVSLGVDLIPAKSCSLDCVYCECGATTLLARERQEFFPLSEVIAELTQVLKQNPELDYITFSGSGEPLLYSRLSELVSFLKKYFPQYQLALLTNATLFDDQSIFEELLEIDLIVPSVDSVIEEEFQKINVPAKDIVLPKILKGLREFKKIFKGDLWIEVFIVPGINDQESSLAALKDYLTQLDPQLIQLNRLDRPGTDPCLQRATDQEMLNVKKMLEPLPISIIGDYEGKNSTIFDESLESKLKTLLSVRPIELMDLIKITGRSSYDIRKQLAKLAAKNLLIESSLEGKTFFQLRH